MANSRTSRAKLWRFLEAFRECGTISAAARAVGIDPKTVYNRRLSDPEFAAAFEEAKEDAADSLEDEARRRAVEGVEEPIIINGKVVATRRKYSDGLLAMLLKAAKPEKYRDSVAKKQQPGQSDIRPELIYERMIEQVMAEAKAAGLEITRAEAIEVCAKFMPEIRRYLPS